MLSELESCRSTVKKTSDNFQPLRKDSGNLIQVQFCTWMDEGSKQAFDVTMQELRVMMPTLLAVIQNLCAESLSVSSPGSPIRQLTINQASGGAPITTHSGGSCLCGAAVPLLLSMVTERCGMLRGTLGDFLSLLEGGPCTGLVSTGLQNFYPLPLLTATG